MTASVVAGSLGLIFIVAGIAIIAAGVRVFRRGQRTRDALLAEARREDPE
jgi:hypothetical protein